MEKRRNIKGSEPLILEEAFTYQTYDIGSIGQGLDEGSLEECCIIIHVCKYSLWVLILIYLAYFLQACVFSHVLVYCSFDLCR